MAALRRNARWLSVGAVAVLVLVGGWWGYTLHAAVPWMPLVMMQPAYTPLDETAQARLDRLRSDCGLDNAALAALDPSAADAEAVLAALRTWFTTNDAELAAARSALADQQQLVRLYRSQIDQGIDATTELASAEQLRVTRQAALDSLLAAARDAATGELTQGQQMLVATMAAQRTLPLPYRALDLTAEQTTALRMALSRRAQRLAITRVAADRAQVLSDFRSELESAIGTTNVQRLATLAGYLGDASGRVVTAAQMVFPSEGGEQG